MNYSYKLGLALLAVLGVSNAALAYRFRFSNHTAEMVQIRMNLAADGTDYDVVLGAKGDPNQEGEIWLKWIHEGITNWENNRKAGFCWNTLQLRTQMKDRGGNIVWGPWKEVNVRYVPSNQYNAMTEASDKAASSIINVGLSAGGKESTGEGSEGIAKGIGSLVAHSQCKDRKFDVVYVSKKSREITLTSLAQ
jgi:hypothetical protein